MQRTCRGKQELSSTGLQDLSLNSYMQIPTYNTQFTLESQADLNKSLIIISSHVYNVEHLNYPGRRIIIMQISSNYQ